AHSPASGSAESRRAYRPAAALALAAHRAAAALQGVRMRRVSVSGFTLVEVLVALAILAVALAAGFRSVSQSADSATALKGRTLALWAAQNRLAGAQREQPAPAAGERSGTDAQAGAAVSWREPVSGTPNPGLR